MTNIKFGIIPYDAETAALKIMEELDVNRDQLISEEEFVTGLSKWLNSIYNTKHDSEEDEDDDYQVTQTPFILFLVKIVIIICFL